MSDAFVFAGIAGRAKEANLPSGLEAIRQRSKVDIDSLDSKAAERSAPFQDATSNQAIAYAELTDSSNPESRKALLKRAAKFAAEAKDDYPEVSLRQLAVEVATVMLSLEMRPFVYGRIHIQVNPFYSYHVTLMVACGKRYLSLVSSLAGLEAKDLSIKIPSTWEGLMACKELEAAGIHTLATTLFTMAQAVVAAEAGCTYIAPYIFDLKVHFKPKYIDPSPNFGLCVSIQQYYREFNYPTIVLAASLTSAQEVMELAGADHITVPPGLIRQLERGNAGIWKPQWSLFPVEHDNKRPNGPKAPPRKITYINDEPAFRLALTCADGGRQYHKLIDAINIFCEKQTQLEELVRPYLEATSPSESQPENKTQRTVT